MLAIDILASMPSEAEAAVKHFNALVVDTGCLEKRLHLNKDEHGTYTLSWDYRGYKPVNILARNINDREVVLIVKALAAW